MRITVPALFDMAGTLHGVGTGRFARAAAVLLPEEQKGLEDPALREYLEAMRELWTHDEAEYHGEFVDFGPSWAWPKPARTPGPLTLVGAAGNEKKVLGYVDRLAGKLCLGGTV